jgi:hypothetical protein
MESLTIFWKGTIIFAMFVLVLLIIYLAEPDPKPKCDICYHPYMLYRKIQEGRNYPITICHTHLKQLLEVNKVNANFI